jgi:TolA-binding protein
MVLDKSGTDDQLLDALRGEISRLKTQLQQSQQQAAAAQSVAHSGRSMADGITSRFSHAGTAALGADKSRQGTLAGSAMMADSLDFLQVQQQQQQEQWENELRQLQGEVQRLRRLCKNQVRAVANRCAPGFYQTAVAAVTLISRFPLFAVGPAGDAGRHHPPAQEEAQHGLPELAGHRNAVALCEDTVSIYPCL